MTYKYPEVVKILRRELDRVHQSAGQNQAVIAKKCGYSAGTFSGYVTGSREPDEDFRSKFAEAVFWEKGQARERRALEAALLDAAGRVQTIYDTVLEKIENGERLTLTTIESPPFAGASDAFFESVFGRFFDNAGIGLERLGNRSPTRPETYESDVLLSFFENSERMLRLGLKFWRVPIRMGLGAVCLTRHKGQASAIGQVLAGLRPKSFRAIRPIVVKNDVGSVHCRKRLGFEGDLIEIPERTIDALADRLIEEGEAGGVAIPVICTDEYTAHRVCGRLRERAHSVFGLNSRRANEEYDPDRKNARREMPQYYCSIAISRKETDFVDFMHEALGQFFSTEIETTAVSLTVLATELAHRMAELLRHEEQADQPGSEVRRWLNAWEWVFYTLSLDTKSIDAYTSPDQLPWSPILKRARQLVQHHIAEATPSLIEFVEALRNEASQHGVDRICAAFDVHLEDDQKRLANPELADSLHQALIGKHPELHFDVQPHDPKSTVEIDRLAARSMVSQMRLLQKLYGEIGRNETVERLSQDIYDLLPDESGVVNTVYGGDTGRILLARVEEENKVIGGACLQWKTDPTGCEIRYLSVDPYYHGRAAGRRLLEKAIEIARRHGSRYIYADVLKDYEVLRAAQRRFSKMGFTEKGEKEPHRIRFELEL